MRVKRLSTSTRVALSRLPCPSRIRFTDSWIVRAPTTIFAPRVASVSPMKLTLSPEANVCRPSSHLLSSQESSPRRSAQLTPLWKLRTSRQRACQSGSSQGGRKNRSNSHASRYCSPKSLREIKSCLVSHRARGNGKARFPLPSSLGAIKPYSLWTSKPKSCHVFFLHLLYYKTEPSSSCPHVYG